MQNKILSGACPGLTGGESFFLFFEHLPAFDCFFLFSLLLPGFLTLPS
jgi:hypothetical protein